MKILLFGVTGSAGGSVLRVCLADPAVEEVRATTRRPPSLEHEKLRVFIHKDFQDYTGVEAAVCWRPAAIDGAPSDNAPRGYKIFRPLFRLLVGVFP